jgi:hypothetical protein
MDSEHLPTRTAITTASASRAALGSAVDVTGSVDVNRSAPPRRRRRLAIAAAIAAAAIAPVVAAPASVSADDALRDRLERACARIEPARNRTTTVIARIDGSADVRGSLAWIQVQIDRANAAGRTGRAAELQRVLDLVSSRRVLLDQRLDVLDRAADVCISKGIAA